MGFNLGFKGLIRNVKAANIGSFGWRDSKVIVSV